MPESGKSAGQRARTAGSSFRQFEMLQTRACSTAVQLNSVPISNFLARKGLPLGYTEPMTIESRQRRATLLGITNLVMAVRRAAA